MFGEVPVLPVVVPLGGTVFVLALWHLRGRGLLTAPRAAVALALGICAAGIVANTIFPIFLDKTTSASRWTQLVNVTPISGYETVDAVINVGVFIPVGVLLSLVAPTRHRWRVLAAAAAVSLSIEATQLVTASLLAGGHVADVNDLTFDVVGAAVGLLLLSALSRVPMGARAIARFQWSEPDRPRGSAGPGPQLNVGVRARPSSSRPRPRSR